MHVLDYELSEELKPSHLIFGWDLLADKDGREWLWPGGRGKQSHCLFPYIGLPAFVKGASD